MLQEALGIVATTLVSFAFLLLLLRVAGKRTLSRMNAFDLIVTVALGSVMARTILSDGSEIASGLFTLASLVGVGFGIEWLSTRSSQVRNILTSDPSLLYHKGRFLHSAMKAERVTEEDIRTAIRREGFPDLEMIEAVVLEDNGEFSVIPRMDCNVTASASGFRKHA